MSVNLSFIGGAGWQFFDDNGDPLSGGKVYTYAAGTTTPATTYTSRDGLTPNANPIILDSAGRTPEQIWSTEGVLYKYVVTTSTNTTIRTWDNIGGSLVASNLQLDLADTTDNAKGDALVGFRQSDASGFLLGATARTVNTKLSDSVSIKDFGAVGDGVVNDYAAIQAAFASGKVAISIPNGTYNLAGNTLTLPANVSAILNGGVLANGTIACNNTFFSGARGLSSTITLTGRVANSGGVFFDWFTCEKSTQTQYNTYINGANSTFGAAPAISATNRTILDMLIVNDHAVTFGVGIYPFDATVTSTKAWYITGVDRIHTLLWAPNSTFLSLLVGGAEYPYFQNISVEAKNQIIYTRANTFNAIHGLMLLNSFFISYINHAFWNDSTVPGGTGCPIYGSKILNCAVYAGAGKGCFAYWLSASNVYDNVVDQFLYFNRQSTIRKGIPLALFYNSNVRDYCNSNIAYGGLRYVAYYDRPSALFTFNAHNNIFESNTNSFDAIVKADASTSNLNLDIGANVYIGTVARENGYKYILLLGNTYLNNNTDDVVLYGNTIRNYSSQYVRAVTTKTDSAGTKYRLAYYEPHSSDETGNSGGSLVTPSATLAGLVGMTYIYAADSANISFIQITPSKWSINGDALGARASGTTANRPTIGLSANYMYFDTTLGRPIWWTGSAWVNSVGVVV